MKRLDYHAKGQAAILLALGMVGLLAFAALAIDGGNAYLSRRNAQNAADAAVVRAARELYRLRFPQEGDIAIEVPDDWIRYVINDAAQRNGVPDTNSNAQDTINANVTAFYLDAGGNRIGSMQVGALGILPAEARGVETAVQIPFSTFIAGIIGRTSMESSAEAAALYFEESSHVQNAIWANATTCDPNTLKLTGSQQVIGGGIHSNGDVSINGNAADPSVYTGTLEYASNVAVSGAIIVDPPDNVPHEVTPTHLPLLFKIEDYAPGGARAVAAGSDYHYLGSGKIKNSDLESAGLLTDGALVPGIYYAEDEFSLNGSLTGDGVTFATPGEFDLSGSSHYFAPYADEQLLFFATGPGTGTCNHTAIKISCSTTVWYGLIYAPYGQVNMSASSNLSAYGSILAYTVDLSGSAIEIHYDERYDPIIPPEVVLIW